MTAVIYARVSSREQEREGYSIPAQRKLLNEYARVRGLSVEHEFVDVESAKNPGRKRFGEMLHFLEAHAECRLVLVEKTDRLYRNRTDAITFEELIEGQEHRNHCRRFRGNAARQFRDRLFIPCRNPSLEESLCLTLSAVFL